MSPFYLIFNSLICYSTKPDLAQLIPYLADQPSKHINIGQYLYSNVPSLKEFCEPATKLQEGMSALKALSTVMLLLQRFAFINHLPQFRKRIQKKLVSLGSKDLECLKYEALEISVAVLRY
jgi:hypothetical protein